MNEFKYDAVNAEVASKLDFQFQGGIKEKDIGTTLSEVRQFKLFQRTSVWHLFDGVMTGKKNGLSLKCFSYGYVQPSEKAGFSPFTINRDYFCVLVSGVSVPDFSEVSAQPSFLKQLKLHFAKSETSQIKDKVLGILRSMGEPIVVEAQGNEVLIYQKEPLAAEEKLQMFKHALHIIDVLTAK